MMWSAVKTPMVASGSRRAIAAALKPTALSVSRPHGSPRNCSGPSRGSAPWIAAAWAAPAQTHIRSAGSSPSSRSTAISSRLRPPMKGINCFGNAARLMGHSRVPEPPAIITAYRIVFSVSFRWSTNLRISNSEGPHHSPEVDFGQTRFTDLFALPTFVFKERRIGPACAPKWCGTSDSQHLNSWWLAFKAKKWPPLRNGISTRRFRLAHHGPVKRIAFDRLAAGFRNQGAKLFDRNASGEVAPASWWIRSWRTVPSRSSAP